MAATKDSAAVDLSLSTPVVPLTELVPPPSERSPLRIYVIRHGQTDWNLQGRIQGGGFDVPLNETGKLQAKRAAEALKGISLDAIVSSSLSRARETANIVMEETKSSCQRIVDEGFNEMSFGVFEGLYYKKNCNNNLAQLERLRTVKQRINEDPDFCFPGSDGVEEPVSSKEDEEFRIRTNSAYSYNSGESTTIVQGRTMKALSRVICSIKEQTENGELHPSKTRHVVIAAHGRTNKIFIAAMLYGKAHGRFREIKQDNVNINVLDLECDEGLHLDTSGKWTARLLNHTQHVDGLTPTG